LARKVMESLVKNGFIQADKMDDSIALVDKTILDDLMVEDKLNEDVRQILDQHAGEVQREGIEYHRMFNLVKAKLAKERNLIL